MEFWVTMAIAAFTVVGLPLLYLASLGPVVFMSSAQQSRDDLAKLVLSADVW
jgi:hypothetical protein